MEMPGVNPFSRGSWHSICYSLDATPTDDCDDIDQIAEVLFSYQTADDWDGTCACVIRLKDGRFMSWESWWGPTGTGFSEDAYGGDTPILFSMSLDNAMRLGISQNIRPDKWKSLPDSPPFLDEDSS